MKLNWKSLWILGVAVLFLLAGYLLQELSGDGDGTAPEVPDSELTPGDLPAVDRTSQATAIAPVPGSAEGRDLRMDELLGGHTIERHVGKTDEQLRDRLEDEPDISAASTYPDLPTAQRVVQAVLDEREDEIRSWENRSGSRPNLALRMNLDETTGRSIRQGQSRAQECEHALVVLRWAGSAGWYVLTSYPECR